MHLLGFHHEHVRPDRYYYIEVLENYVQDDKVKLFKRIDRADKDVTWYQNKFKYDFHSILHYKPDLYAKCIGYPTFKIYSKAVIENFELSDIDIEKLKYFYNCSQVKSALDYYQKYIDKLSDRNFCYNRFQRRFCPQRKFIKYSQGFSCYLYYNQSEVDTDFWHTNFGQTPSEYPDEDSKMNFYLHFGSSSKSYNLFLSQDILYNHPYFKIILIDKCGIFKIPKIDKYEMSTSYCLSFVYKFWGFGEKTLQIGYFNQFDEWTDIFSITYTTKGAHRNWQPMHIMQFVSFPIKTFGIGGCITNGGNIAIDNITLYECNREPLHYYFNQIVERKSPVDFTKRNFRVLEDAFCTAYGIKPRHFFGSEKEV
ncbi:zinc metalloproteinase nas-4-like protein [Dinothrombium tinctorium]|uniref:Zinc metalloproteinase nas-4-like protein n=1 Tax=Dinothrombium tinctorium TaxID=1965070 RepID=A0A443QR81_9ACAR|nr:zinc metalloproteinase nas-4-like protein [Dinothrombium tinctorium]RWS05806.1 zinc metalloproteinase nas-4-like protein [Dinothrombium tinctorium]